LYRVDRDGAMTRITTGEFDAIKLLGVDERGGQAFFLASPEQPTQRYLYAVALDGKSPAKRLTPPHRSGWNEYEVSPDGTQALHTWSAFGAAPEIELVTLPGHRNIRALTTNEIPKVRLHNLARRPAEKLRVDIGGGVQLDGWLMLPPDFDPEKKYPLLFHVYGEPASQAVVDRWGGNNYLWHLMLTQQGYAVACLDNRGTPGPRGREWRKAAFRKVGTLAANDQAAAARALLKERKYLDPERVGAWGWSGGGSSTLNLLFRHPDLYRAGVAVAPVPDMRLYDTIYQERYMGLPQENPKDYELGSPLTHAAGLKGDLLIIHGTGDDNCHYQGVEKLVNRLVELDKPFQMLAYPNRSHSINEGRNTSKHLYGAMTRFLNERLPPGPRP
ncbi:MAG TPA: prolyl oligopeptidase family serine peptidase, partial [Planctomycetia bacterium]|nr:prolyl oligopeptidase family serine peptidase [Planctomycetia bacterium]